MSKAIVLVIDDEADLIELARCGAWIETTRGFGYKFRESNPQE
jgi:hypothetical protein